MNRVQKEKLREQIEKLDSEEHAQIFEIIKQYTDNYTKTQTGVMISSDNLPDKCLQEIQKLVHFYNDLGIDRKSNQR
jgi:Bromodomain extra-terminal - transcription regulation